MVLMPLSTLFQLYRGGQVFVGGRNRSTRRKPPTCRKSLTHFITCFIEYTSPMSVVGTHNFSGDKLCLHR